MKLFNWNIEINYVGGYGFIFSFTHTYFTWFDNISSWRKGKKFSDPLVYQTVWFCLRFHRILSILLLLTRPYRQNQDIQPKDFSLQFRAKSWAPGILNTFFYPFPCQCLCSWYSTCVFVCAAIPTSVSILDSPNVPRISKTF